MRVHSERQETLRHARIPRRQGIDLLEAHVAMDSFACDSSRQDRVIGAMFVATSRRVFAPVTR